VGPPVTAWQPEDYFLRNLFCPPQNIQQVLDAERERLGLPWLILFTVGPATPLRSLVFVSSARVGFADHIRDGVGRQSLVGQSALLRSESAAVTAFFESIVPDELIEVVRSADVDVPPESLAVWIVVPAGLNERIRESALRDLLLMVNATAIANTRRDHYVTALISDIRRDPSESADRPNIEAMLKLASAVVPQTQAAFYDFDPSNGRLNRVAVSVMSRPAFVRSILIAAADTADVTIEATIVKAFLENQAVLSQDRMAPHVAAWVAIPVPAAPYGRRQANLGVIAVRRSDLQADTTFSLFELTLLRNVALRLAFEMTLARADSFGDEVSRLTGSIASRRDPAAPDLRGLQRGFGWDFLGPIDDLQLLAEHARTFTRSNSVTIRALVPVANGGPGDFALERLVASPPKRIDDRLPTLSLSKALAPDSAHVYAAVTNKLVNIFDLEIPVKRQVPGLRSVQRVRRRGKIRSEVCAPIVVDGLVVATLNLESVTPHNYDEKLAMIRSYAALAGLAITSQRRSTVSELSERLARLRIGNHESRTAAAVFSQLEHAGDLTPVQATHLRKLESIIFGSEARRSERRFSDTGTVPVRALLEARADEQKTRSRATFAISRHVRVDPKTAAALDEAIEEILLNLHKYSPTPITYEFRSARFRLGAQPYLVVSVMGPVGDTPSASLLSRMYRVPIEDLDGDIPHLGAFSVGEAIRSIGGDVYALLHDDLVLETRILIPKTTRRSM